MGDKYFYVHIKIFVEVAPAGATATQAASFARSELSRVAYWPKLRVIRMYFLLNNYLK